MAIPAHCVGTNERRVVRGGVEPLDCRGDRNWALGVEELTSYSRNDRVFGATVGESEHRPTARHHFQRQ